LYVVEDRSLVRLGAMFGVGTKTVRRVLMDAGIPIRTRDDTGRRHVLQPASAVELRRLAGEGLSVGQIARRLGVSQGTAAGWLRLREAGISRPQASRKNRPSGGDRPSRHPPRTS
jgi:hypothetical protein